MTTIIVGTDLSDNARTAAHWALGLARRVDSATLRFVQVLSNDDYELRQAVTGHTADQELAHSKRAIEKWVDDLPLEGLTYAIDILIGRRDQRLRDAVDEWDAQWLVLGKSGRGRLARLFVGSTAQRLAYDPPCPIVLVHPDTEPWAQPFRAVAAVDLGASSAHGAAMAGQLVRRHGGGLKLVHIISLPQGTPPLVTGPTSMPETLTSYLDETQSWARQKLQALIEAEDLPIADIDDVAIRPGYPIAEVMEVVEDIDANLLCLGSHGRHRVMEFIMGDVGRSLVKRAPCTVIIAPQGDDERDGDAGDNGDNGDDDQ